MSFHKSEDRKKLKDKFKKGLKEVKKSVGKIVNKAADKLVPKEIAPFLPLAGMFVPGGMGITSYLLPQLLTALSTGKTRGDISLTGQALTGLGSFLKDPGPMFKGEPAPFGTKVVTDPSSQISFDPEYFTGSMEVPKTFADLQNPSLLDAMKEDVRLARQFFQGTGPVTERAVIDGKIQRLPVVDAAGNPITKASLGMFDKANFPRLAAQAAIFGAPPLKDFYDTASDELDAAIREQEEAERRRKQARARLGDFFFSLSDPTGRFRNFDLSGLMGLAAGGRVGFSEGGRDEVGQRLAERGIKSEAMMNRLKTQAIDQFRKKNKIPTSEVLEIAGNNAFQSFLGNFVNKGMNKMMKQAKDFSKKVDLPETREEYFERVGMGPFTQKSMVDMFAADGGRVSAQEGGIMETAPGMPEGMQVDGRNGTFIPMGVKEKADDVPAMLSKNEFVMTADAVRAAGGGSVNKGAQRMYDLMNTLEAMV